MLFRRKLSSNSGEKPRREPLLFPSRADVHEDSNPFRETGLGAPTPDREHPDFTGHADLTTFRAQVRSSVVLIWLLPPAFGIFLALYQGFYTASEMLFALQRFGFAYFAICTLAAALFLPRHAARIARSVLDVAPGQEIDWRRVRNRLRFFRLTLFASFASYCMLWALGTHAVDIQRHGKAFAVEDAILSVLVTVPGVVLSALPIFFRLSNQLGAFFAAHGGAFVFGSIRTRFFALGMLPAIMVGGALLLYVRDRTGVAPVEAVAVTGALLLVSWLAMSIAWRSFSRSLAPLQEPLRDFDAPTPSGDPRQEPAARLIPNSLDEIGLLVRGWSRIIERDKAIYERITFREALMRQVTDSPHGLVAYIDPDERFTFVNSKYGQWWNVEPETIVGQSLSEFLPPEIYSKLTPRIAAAFAGVETSDSTKYTYPDGKTRICEMRLLPDKADDGSVRGIIALTLDITDREVAKEAARQAHSRLLDAIESLPVAFTLYNPEERLVICNSMQRKFTPWHGDLCIDGMKFEELVRNTASRGIASGVDKDDPSAVDRYVVGRLADFRAATGEQTEIRRSDGRTMHSIFRKTSDGGTVGITFDVTEQKEVEKLAHMADQRLRDAIEAMPAGFRIFDPDERLVLWNSHYQESTRWHGGRIEAGLTFEEILQKTVKNRGWIDQADTEAEYIAKRLAQFRNPGPSYEVSRADGRHFLHQYKKTADGGTVSVMLEITAQKQAELRSETDRRRLVDSLNALPIGFRLYDRDERLAYANSQNLAENTVQQGFNTPGVLYEEMLRNTVAMGNHIHDMENDEAYIENKLAAFRAADGKPIEFRRFDGRSYLSIFRKTSDGETASILVDITERKKAELEAEQHRRRLVDSLNCLPIGFRLYDREDRLVYTNDQNVNQLAWHSTFLEPGATYEEILRRSVAGGVHFHDMESDEDYIARRLEEFRIADGKPIERRRSDGRTALMMFRRTTDDETASIVLDITEQKEAEWRAVEFRQQLSDAVESLPAGFWLFDAAERLVMVNTNQKEMAHWQNALLEPGVTYEEILRDGVAKGMYLHEFESDEEFLTNVLNHFRSENPSPYELHYVTGRHVLAYFRKTAAGGTVSVQLDVTDRYEAERRAKEASQRLFDAIESLPVGFCLYNREEQLVLNNSRQRDATPWHANTLRFGITFEELVRSSIEKQAYQDLDYDDPAAVEAFVAARLENFRNPQKEAVELTRSDGATTLTAFHRTTDGGTVSVILDITERKRSERALKTSEGRLNAILDLAPEAIVTTDTEGRIQMFNAGAERLFGYAAHEAAGRNIECLLAGQEKEGADPNAAVAGTDRRTLRREGRWEAIACHREGREFPVEISSGETAVEGERLITVLFQDISERKRWENDLRNAMQLADAANRAKSEFLSHMSHELRTPLNGILGYAEFIRDKWLGDDALDKYIEYAGFITESGQHLLQLINDILDLSKVEAGQYEPVFRSVDFEDLFNECSVMVTTEAEKAGVAIHCKILPGSAIWTADRRALKQILINLLSNAVKFSDAGARVDVTASRDDTGHYCLEVADSGIGMTEDEARRALEPFVQVGQPYVTQQKGTGLGLALVVRLAALHHGTVEMMSEPGKGTTVKVVLPPLPRAKTDANRPHPLSA